MSTGTAASAADTMAGALATLTGTMNYGAFTIYGVRMAVALGIAYVTYMALRDLLAGKPPTEMLADAVMVVLTFMLVLWVIRDDALFMGIFTGFEYICGRIFASVTGSGFANSEAAYKQALAALLSTVNNLFGVSEKGWMSWATLKELGSSADVLLFKFFIAITVLGITLMFLSGFVVSQVMFVIAAILAPIMVPFYIVPPLSFIAESWFKFMLSAGFQKIAGTLMMAITISTIKGAAELSERFGSYSSARFGLFAVIFLMLGIMGYLMMSAGRIGMGLAMGRGAMGANFMPARMSPSAVMANGVGKMGRAAGTGAGAAAGAVRGAKSAIQKARKKGS